MARRRGPRGDVTLPLLLAAAERVLAEHGPDGLTLRAVAQEAGISPNAVYTYVDDMSELRHQLADDYLGRIDLELLHGPKPAASFPQFLRHVLDLLRASPGHLALLAADRVGGPHALALNEALLRFFVSDVGHSREHAAICTATVTEWVHGAILLALSEVGSPAFHRAIARADLSAYPLTAAMTPVGPEDGVALIARAVLGPAP